MRLKSNIVLKHVIEQEKRSWDRRILELMCVVFKSLAIGAVALVAIFTNIRRVDALNF